MKRTALRVATALAAVALVLPTSIAQADDRPADARGWGLSSELQANTPLVEALRAAREEYRTAVLGAKTQLRTTLESVRQQVSSATADAKANLKAAGDAYTVADGRSTADAERLRAAYAAAAKAYRDALATARASTQRDFDTALAQAKSTLSSARSLYIGRVKAAFQQFAGGQAAPATLLEPDWWPGLGDGSWLGVDRKRQRR
jgi:hypothetical protein